MCIPVAAAMVVMAAAAVMQGVQAHQMANAQEQVSKNQAAYAEDNARAAADKIRKAGRAQVGAATAALAASGVKLGEGTPLEIKDEITKGAEEDALVEILNGRRVASVKSSEASMYDSAGRNAMTNSVLKAGSQMYSGWQGAGTQAPAPVSDAKFTSTGN